MQKVHALLLALMNREPSMVPVVPKVQQLPHMAWSFTGVTAPEEQIEDKYVQKNSNSQKEHQPKNLVCK